MDKARLQQTVAKLRAIIAQYAAAVNATTAVQNPYLGAWYRKQYADREFVQYPPKGSQVGSFCSGGGSWV